MRNAMGLGALWILAGCGAHLHGTVVATTSPEVAEVNTHSAAVSLNDTVKIVHHTCNAGRASNAARRHCDMWSVGTASVVSVLDAHHVLVRALDGATLHEGDTIEPIGR